MLYHVITQPHYQRLNQVMRLLQWWTWTPMLPRIYSHQWPGFAASLFAFPLANPHFFFADSKLGTCCFYDTLRQLEVTTYFRLVKYHISLPSSNQMWQLELPIYYCIWSSHFQTSVLGGLFSSQPPGGLHRGRPKLRFAPSLGCDDTLQARHLGRQAATYREATEGGGCDVFRDLSGLVESKLGWSGTGLNYIQWLL